MENDTTKPKRPRKTPETVKNKAITADIKDVVNTVETILPWQKIGERIESEFELRKGTFTALTHLKFMRIVAKVVKIAIEEMVAEFLTDQK